MTERGDEELDELFRMAPAEFVAARDALSARRKQRGDKPGAARVKALKRPTPSAWALNQLHFREAESLSQARLATEAVRTLHARDGVSAHEIRAAHDMQRSAIQRVAEEALRMCEEAGLPGGPPQAKKITATVRGILAGLGDEPLGRMTRDLEASGFDAIATLGTPAVRPKEDLVSEADARVNLVRQRAISAADARVQASESALRRQQSRIEQEQRMLESSARHIEELKTQLAQAQKVEREKRAMLDALETELEAMNRELDAARAARSALA